MIELEDLLAENPELWYSFELLQSLTTLDDVPEGFIEEFKSLLEKQPDADEVNRLMLDQIDSQREITNLQIRPRSKYKNVMAYSLTALLAGVLLWFGISTEKDFGVRKNTNLSMNEIVAPKGSKTKITLNDGTAIWLNAGSQLRYSKNFSMENREVYLNGEGYFEVEHNDKYSFIVHTENADIVDLGTTFNVKAYKESATTETTLIEGSLEVVLRDKTAKRIMIKPNEKVVLQNSLLKEQNNNIDVDKAYEVTSIIPFASTRDVVETAWISNKLIFRNQRFEELCSEMERKYDVKIHVEDEKIKNYRVTGIFKNENVEEALKLLQVILPFKYKINNDEINIEN